MTAEAQNVIATFETLPDEEKREVLAKLMRMAGQLEYPEVSDDALVAIADDLFREYDRRESD